MRIFEATSKDFDSIITIQKGDGYDHHYYLTVERLGSLTKRGEVFFIAQIDGKPVGFAGVDFEQRTRLHFLCVLVDCQNKGIGGALMKRMLDEASSRGYTSTHSYVETPSSKERFLAKQQFSQVGFYKDRYGPEKTPLSGRLS